MQEVKFDSSIVFLYKKWGSVKAGNYIFLCPIFSLKKLRNRYEMTQIMEENLKLAHSLQGNLDRIRSKEKRRVSKVKADFEKKLQAILRDHFVLKGIKMFLK